MIYDWSSDLNLAFHIFDAQELSIDHLKKVSGITVQAGWLEFRATLKVVQLEDTEYSPLDCGVYRPESDSTIWTRVARTTLDVAQQAANESGPEAEHFLMYAGHSNVLVVEYHFWLLLEFVDPRART